jgi:hypothetical protein
MRLLATIAILVSGLQGTVTKGPTTPVCRAGQTCTAPAQVTLLFRRASRVYRIRTAPDGSYRIVLPTGYYTVTTVERIGISRNIRPQAVHVRRGHVDRLNFSIDTGIR